MITVLAYDIGTTGVKTCLFEIDEVVREIDSARAGYGITILPNGGAEQDPDDWWAAMVASTKELATRHDLSRVDGVSFCSQMQALVLVGPDGLHKRPAMSYMDQRAGKEMREIGGAFPRVAGVNLSIAVKSIYHTAVVAASIKDPVWKYHWVRKHEPHLLSEDTTWLDVKDALVARMTGELVMSEDSAFATLLMDHRADEPRFSPEMLKMLKVNPAHMPKIIASTDVAGHLLDEPAAQLGLPAGTPVFSGGGDASLIGVGAGATDVGDTHVYMGTSGWVSTVTDKLKVDLQSMMAAVVGAIPGRYNYFAELETAGKCLEWVKDHLALDEINIYLSKRDVSEDPETKYESLYDYLSEVISTVEPGAGGVLFAPWLHGNRSPFEDPNARAMIFNIGLETGKTEILRAVVEGVCYHLRWFLETSSKKVTTSQRVRFVGGGALSPVTAQILADVLGHGVDVVANPQDVGAVGAALVVAAGLDHVTDLGEAAKLVEVVASYEPNPGNREVYDRMYEAFTQLHSSNKKIFSMLNGG